jgi:hypothetical protein
VVRVLLERNDVDPIIADDKYGRIRLSWDASDGRGRAVRKLLGWNDVNPYTADN